MKSIKLRAKNEAIRGLREKLGITQSELAEILQVARSTLAMHEGKERPLPSVPLLKLAVLQIRLSELPEMNSAKAPHPSEHIFLASSLEASRCMTEREAKCRAQSKRLNEELKLRIAEYERTRQWLHLAEHALEEKNFRLANEAEWWKLQRHIAISKLAGCGTPVQQKLRSRIALLDGEAELNRNVRFQMRNK